MEQFARFERLIEQQWLVLESFHRLHDREMTELDTLYLGGGTPSLWGKRGANFMGNFLRRHNIQFAPQFEFTLEVDPNAWAAEEIEQWQSAGVSRYSIGAQALDDHFLEKMDRDHNVEQILELCSSLHSQASNYSVDFMIGLPGSKKANRDILGELDQILSYGPSHISLYILGVRKNYVHYKDLPVDDYIRSEYLAVSDFLKSRGFVHYEVSNFALPGYESRHNGRYWMDTSVAALGPSATGVLSLGEKRSLRYKWKVTAANQVLEDLGTHEKLIERLYFSFRTNSGFKESDLFSGENLARFNELVQSWESQGYVTGQNYKRSTALGYLMADSLMDDIFKRISL